MSDEYPFLLKHSYLRVLKK